MFGFIFQGTKDEFDFFKDVAEHQIPDAELTLERIDKDEIHCLMVDDAEKCFLAGMVLSEVYAQLGR